MRRELAVKLAEEEAKDQPLHIKMRTANAIYTNNGGDSQKPFAQVDVVFAEFVDYLNEQASQRERDLVLVSDQLCPVWKTLHITMQVLKETPSPADERSIKNLVGALHRLEKLNLIREGLNPKLCKWIDAIVKEQESQAR